MADNQSTPPAGGVETLPVAPVPAVTTAETETAIINPLEHRDRWVVYVIRDKATGRFYVGVTWRPLNDRISSHVNEARRKRRVRSGGLIARLRELDVTSRTFAQHFDVSVVATSSSQDEVRRLEAEWIGRLEAKAPLSGVRTN